MKKLLLPFILVVLLSYPGACLNAKLYYEYNPESVVYSEYDDTYYFAFLGKRDRSNLTDPGIVAYMDSNKELFQFYVMVYWGDDIRQATNPKGLYVVDNLLYLCEYNKLVAYDLEKDTATKELYLNDLYYWKEPSLNDICADNMGFLYVTDFVNNTIYKVDVTTDSITDLGLQEYIQKPRCIEYDEENDRLILVSCVRNAPIQAVSLNDYSVTTLMETDISLMYGITKDNKGGFFVSAWEDSLRGAGKIYRFDKDFSEAPTVFADGLGGPSGIYYNKILNELVSPNMLDTTYSFYSLTIPSIPPKSTYPEDGQVNLETGFKLEWENIDIAMEYNIQISTSDDFSSVAIDTTTSSCFYESNDMELNTKYYWRVKAVNLVGESPWSGTKKFTTSKIQIDPPELTLFVEEGTQITTTRPIFKWAKQNADYYRLQISTPMKGVCKEGDSPLNQDFFNALYDIDSIVGEEYTMEEDLQNNMWYFWRLKAYDEEGTSLWSDTMAFWTNNPESVMDITDNNSLTIYPNPANDYLMIKTDKMINNIEIVDVFGRLMKKEILLRNNLIDISSLSPGQYYLKYEIGDKVTVKRFLIVR